VLVVAGGVLGSLSLLSHFGVIGAHTIPTGPIVAHGGSWTIGSVSQPDSLIPNGSGLPVSAEIDQALYLPLFYSDAFGMIHAGAASAVPTVQNEGISADATTWTVHLLPHLVWSDGQPYDARDVDYTWKLWLNPAFGVAFPSTPTVLQMISSAVVSSDHLTITFHLKQPYVPFLQYWVDGYQAPLPAHHFSAMAPGQILKSQDNLNPKVTSGPFLMAESAPGNHITLVHNPHYYQARQGLPYLDKVVLRILSQDALNAALQAGAIDSTTQQSLDEKQDYTRLHSYALVTPPSSIYFGAVYFNFKNTVLAGHLEVRQAIAMAMDYQALIQSENAQQPGAVYQECTDHSAFYHPGFDPTAPCPIFDQTAANQLLDNNGWVRGHDGVRAKGGQRLEFEFSAPINPNNQDRLALEAIIQRDLQAVGIKLDIQNYSENLFFSSFITGKASPPTGAVAGRYDIAEFSDNLGLDPDDSALLACNQAPPNGVNLDFYCNPALDALYKQELATPDPGARQNIFEHIHLLYLTQFPFIVLFGEYDHYILRKVTHNFQPSPLGFTDDNIWQWWCDGGKC
jgi:peptide/nickel transport system substrate-binding protein